MNRLVVVALLFVGLLSPLCGLPCFAQDDGSADASAKLAFFSQPGCKKCRHVKAQLAELQRERPGLEVRVFSMARRHNRVLLEAVGFRAGVEQDKRLIAPSVFVGEEALVGEAITREALAALIDRAGGPGNSLPGLRQQQEALG